MSLTPAQARAAYAPGSVAVVAGAGSGKTHMLTARYLHHLGADALSPLEVVAVTFTEKAAAELRARIRAEVQRARPHDLEGLAELEAAQISTIHALCARVLRDHPAAAGVRPDATVLDSGPAWLWREQQLPRALGQLPPRLFGHLPYSRMLTVMRTLLDDPVLAGRALDVGAGHWSAWAREARGRALGALLGRPDWEEVACTLQAHAGAEGDLMETARRAALTQMQALERGEGPHGPAEALAGLVLRGGAPRAWPAGGLSEVKAALGALRDLMKAEMKRGLLTLEPGSADEWLAAALPDVREAFGQVDDTLRALKRQAGLLDFADLEVHALRALRDPSVQAHYQARWKAFLIDEAQDTNPVQAEILGRLSQGSRRTVVGDEKQAIYGFRRADVASFRQVRADIGSAGGTDVGLDLSFRTHRRLVEQGNQVFAPLLGALHAPLQALRVSSGGPASAIEGWIIDETDLKSKPRRQTAEAALIARRVRGLLDEGFEVFDRQLGQGRPLRPGDVAVLTRGWAALPRIGKALAAAGIPVADAGGGSLLDTREARDGLALLSAVALQDGAAVLTVLRSPWCAVSDRAIWDLARERGEADWTAALAASTDPRLERARTLLAELTRERRHVPPSRLLQLADRLSGYTAVLANFWDAERRLADWRGFVDLVREAERDGDELFTVIRGLREQARERIEVPRPVLEGGNAVTLSTMHSSKGLEWPLVVLADTSWSAPPGTPEVLVDPAFGVALRAGEETLPPVAYTLIAERLEAREEAEARRLLYVALTRARDHVIVTASGAAGKGTLLEKLLPGLLAAGVDLQVVAPPPEDLVLPPLPGLPVPPEPVALWTDPVPLPEAPAARQALSLPGLTGAPAGSWDEVLDLLDPDWVDFARALEAEGIPAPSEVHLDLPHNGRVTHDTALMFWHRAGRDVALLEPGTDAGRDLDALVVRRDDDPRGVAHRLRERLPGPAARP